MENQQSPNKSFICEDATYMIMSDMTVPPASNNTSNTLLLEDSLSVLGTLLNSFCLFSSFIGGHLLFIFGKDIFFYGRLLI